MSKKWMIFLAVIAAALLSTAVFAEDPDRIISNSEDWKDVYSVILYGNLIGKPANFLVSDRHATLILNSISKDSHIWAISSRKVPQVVGYKNFLESRGYSSEEFVYENANLEIAERLEDIKNFIVIDDSYGYNAISVAPYAVITQTYVLFADRSNINEIDSFLSGRNPDKVIIYGNVDREVRNTLQKYNPEIINKDGDRFLNNIEIAKKYQEIRHAKQAVLTNGEFIEQEVMSGSEPVIFIGTNNVPDATREYVQGSDIDVGVLIGNELVGTATFIRRQMGISVFVKFAQGARSPQGSISQVEALDMFYLPTYSLNLEIQSIKFNRATNKLEVTLRNTVDQAIYFIGSYSLAASDGSRQTVGDIGANFIDGNEVKTLTYDAENIPEGDLSVEVFIIYGESKGSLEKEIRKTMRVESVRILDECEIEVTELSFRPGSRTFYANVENTGSVDCYVDMELVDLVIAGERKTFALESITELPSGSNKNLRIKVEEIEDEDLEDNQEVRVRAYYGEREDTLFKTQDKNLPLIIKGPDYLTYSLALVIIVLLILIIWKRRKKKEEHKKV